MTARYIGIIVSACLLMSLGSLAAAPGTAPRILPLGDSITAGWNQPSYRLPLARVLQLHECEFDFVGPQTLTSHTPANPGRYPGIHFPSFSPATHPDYPAGEHWDPGLGDDTDHAGYPGLTTEELLNTAWATVRRAQPDYVLLHIGTNDIRSSTAPNTPENQARFAIKTVGKINELITAIYSSHREPDNVKVLLANLVPTRDQSRKLDAPKDLQMSKTLSRYIAALVKGKNDPRLLLVDVATGFDTASMTTDGIHPNAAGERHIAAAFFNILHDSGLCDN